MPLFLVSWGTFPINKLVVQYLFREVRVRYVDNMTSPSESVLGDGGSDGRDASLLQDAAVGASILRTNPEDFSVVSLMICL